ncbi:MAG: hypothetical protein IT446_14820 [Phycisphaerales bacterium]|nr:hypothetical protein [Phycisphaerales bacterium]
MNKVYPLEQLRRLIPPRNVKHGPSHKPTGNKSAVDRCMAYLAKCPDSVSGNRGHDAMLRAACECLRFGLADGDAMAVLRWFNGEKADPQWSESELTHKLASAKGMVNGDFGCRLKEPKKQHIAGDNEPEAGPVDRKNPLPLARGFRTARYMHDDGPTLIFCGDEFHAWRNNCHSPVENAQIRKEIYGYLEPLETIRQAGENEIIEPFKPRDRDVNTVIDALKAVCHLAASAPAWIDGEGPDPSQLIVAPNGVFTITEEGIQKVCEPTPRLFVANALDYPLITDAPEPVEWLKFLKDIFEADQQRIRLLQEWIGYVLTFDTKLQKILLILGPPRSGKGTIARIITRIIGADNVCAPTLAGLATNFGLWPLIGKQLAIIGDARLSGRSDQAIVVERLLSISGEDSLTIDRKNREPLTTRLRARLMMLSNEIPKLADSSSAVANRFVILPLQKSFLGHEDIGLTDRLLAEVPQIAAWAIKGLMRLRASGRFTEPAAADDLRQEMADLGSPISAFIRDWCRVAAGQSVAVADLYAAWCCWCIEQGSNHPGTVQILGRDLRAAMPGITASKLRDGDNRVPTYNGIGLTLAAAEAVAADRAKKAGER